MISFLKTSGTGERALSALLEPIGYNEGHSAGKINFSKKTSGKSENMQKALDRIIAVGIMGTRYLKTINE